MLNRLFLSVLFFVLFMGGLAMAAPDPGIPDTVSVHSLTIPSGTTEFAVEVHLYNDERLGGCDIPITWSAPPTEIICDSVSWLGSRADYVSMLVYEIDTTNQMLHAGFVIFFESTLQVGDGLIFTAHFSVLPGAPDQIINIDSTFFPPVGTLALTLPNSSQIYPQFNKGTVTLGELTPTISATPPSLNFTAVEGGSNPATQDISISNSGSSTLNWTASDNASWLSLSPTSGVDAGTVTATVNTVGLSAGPYSASITISDPAASNDPVTIPVTLNIDLPPPCLLLSTNLINFSGVEGDILSQNFTISNCGGQPLNWTISGIDAAWLALNSSSGTGPATVGINANLTGLAPGDYSDTITVSADPGTGDAPQDIVVNLSVIDTTPDADSVYVANISGTAGVQTVVDINYRNFIPIRAIMLPLNYSGTDIVCDSVSFVGSRVAIMDSKTVIIDSVNSTIAINAFQIFAPSFDPGTGLLARLYFSSNPLAATQTVPIDTGFIPPANDYLFLDTNGAIRATEFFAGSIDLTGLPCFIFPVDTVFLTGFVDSAISTQSHLIANNCYGTLSWSAFDNAGWLELSPISGGDGTLVEFSVNTFGLGEGVHHATVSFSSNAFGSPTNIPVKLTLVGVPILTLSNSTVDLGNVCQGDVISGSFNIFNLGTGSMAWTATASPEVTLSPTSGVAPTTVDYDINTGGLNFGPQQVVITVDAGNAQQSPKTLTISMEIMNCADCSFDIAEVDGPQGLPIGVPIYANQISNVAGLDFHFFYNVGVIFADSITSDYLDNITYGFFYKEIHLVWEDMFNPVSIPSGDPIMTLWFTTIGDIGRTSPIEWLRTQSVVNDLGEDFFGLGYCKGEVLVIEPIFDLGGHIVYYDMTSPMEAVPVDLTGTAPGTTPTDANGDYLFANLDVGTYTVTPNHNADDAGVSVADIIKIRRHIAYLELLDSPYKLIAGDVNLSGTISVGDVISLRRYLAALSDLPGGNWVFVDSDYLIDDSNWPTAPQSMTTYLNVDITLSDFIGIRLGDVNSTWDPNAIFAKANHLGGPAAAISIANSEAAAGNIISIPIRLSDVKEMAGLEFHLEFDNHSMEFVSIRSELLKEITTNGLAGEVHLIWEDFLNPIEVGTSETIATVSFRLRSGFSTSTEINFTGAEVVNAQGLTYPLDLSGGILVEGYGNGSSILPTMYLLFQNKPNPFNPQTTIRAAMPEAGAYELAIYNIMGQKIKRFIGSHEAGFIEFSWDGTDQNGQSVVSGMYLYQFTAGTFSATKKMVLLK